MGIKQAYDFDELVFVVTVEELQYEARRLIRRKLNHDELRTAIKCVNCGLSTDILTIYRVAIEEAIGCNVTDFLKKK